MIKSLSLSAMFVFFFHTVFSQTGVRLTKEKTLELYQSLYVTSSIDSIEWKGDVKKCNAGSLNQDIYLKAENRVNFFRLMCGLKTVKVNPAFNSSAQSAAFLIKANNQLSHAPPSTWKCYNQVGAKGCEKSCLALTDFGDFPSSAFITGFIDDFGEGNYAVGHRKWILYSRLKEFGYGATNSTEALFVADGTTQEETSPPEFISYPWNGYVPIDLIFPKWSFSIPDNKTVDFSNAVVMMTDGDGHRMEVKRLKERKKFLDHTIVWTVSGMFTDDEIQYGQNTLEAKGYLNKLIRVVVKGVRVDGKIKNYEYSVQPIRVPISSD